MATGIGSLLVGPDARTTTSWRSVILPRLELVVPVIVDVTLVASLADTEVIVRCWRRMHSWLALGRSSQLRLLIFLRVFFFLRLLIFLRVFFFFRARNLAISSRA